RSPSPGGRGLFPLTRLRPLHYKRGVLVTASTRGGGPVGDPASPGATPTEPSARSKLRQVSMSVEPRPRRVSRDRRLGAALLPVLVLALAVVGCLAAPAWGQPAQPAEPAYRAFPYIGSRLAIWIVAQIHLNFAAFILGVPIFAVIIEFMGWRNGASPE